MSQNLISLAPTEIITRPDFNPRQEIDVSDLTDSIRQHGILTPLTVVKNGEGYKLVAGERRLTAAIMVGMDEVPAIVVESSGSDTPDADELVLAIVENTHREDLTIVEEATAAARLRELGYRTRKQVAAKLSISQNRAKLLEQIAACPPEVKEHLHVGRIAPSVAPTIAKIAEASPELAAHVVERALDNNWTISQFEESWPQLLASGYREEIEGEPDAPKWFVIGAHYDPSYFPLDEKAAAKVDEITGMSSWGYGIEFTEADADAARAYGCLVEHEHDTSWRGYLIITDQQWAFDRVASHVVPRDLKAARKRAKQEEEWRQENPGQPRANEPVADEAARTGKTEEEVREARKAQREEEQELRLEADAFNHELSKQIFERLDSVKLNAGVADLIVGLVLRDDFGDVILRGLNYLHPGWREDEELKNGKIKTTFLQTQEDARKKGSEYVHQAQSPEQKLGRVCQLVLAAHLADHRVVARSRRSGHQLGARQNSIENAEKLIDSGLETLLKQLTPKLRASATERRKQITAEGAWNA